MRPQHPNEWWIDRFKLQVGVRVHLLQRFVRRWLGKRNDVGHPGIGHVLTLATGIVAGTAAMITFLQEAGTTKRDFLMWIYMPAVCAPIIFLFVLSILPVRSEGGWRYYFDLQTRFCGRVVGVVATLAVVLVVWNGLAGTLPGQEPPGPISFDEVYPDKTGSGERRVVASVALDKDVFPDGLPLYFFFTLSLKDPLIDRWQFDQVMLYRHGPEGQLIAIQRFRPGSGIDARYFPLPFEKEVDKNQHYSLRVTLRPRVELKEAEAEAMEVVNLIREGIGIEAFNKSGP